MRVYDARSRCPELISVKKTTTSEGWWTPRHGTRVPIPAAAAHYGRPKPAGQERAGTMGGSHDYEVKVMYRALIESTS